MAVSSRLEANNLSNHQLGEALMIPSSFSTEYDMKPATPISFEQDSINRTGNYFFLCIVNNQIFFKNYRIIFEIIFACSML